MPISVALFLLAFQTLFGFLYRFAVFGQIAVDEFILDFLTTNYLFGDFFVCLHQFRFCHNENLPFD